MDNEKSSFHVNRSWRLLQGPMSPRKVEHQQICCGNWLACVLPLVGKIRGMAETIDCWSRGESPAWRMLMRSVDQEKAKSLTILDPMAFVSLAPSIWLGDVHEYVKHCNAGSAP